MGGDGILQLRNGRSLQLQEFHQNLTYGGWLEGLPTVRWNKIQLDHVVKAQREKAPQTPIYLVPPKETPIPMRPGESYALGEPSELPRVTCIGLFWSARIGERDPLYLSELVVIWLQDEYAMPIQPDILAHIGDLDWDSHASNFER